MISIEEISEIVQRKVAERKFLRGQLAKKNDELAGGKKRWDDLTKSRFLITEASIRTQKQFKAFVESLVTMAVQSVFPEHDYKFVVDVDMKANRSQINLMIQQEDKEPYIPEDEQGGALLDIISFALRIVLWSLEKPRSRNVLLFDEPFRFCGDLTPLASGMLKEISSKIKIQIIVVTHDDRIIEIADRAWSVSRAKGGVSKVVQLTEHVEEEPKKVVLRRRA